MIIKLDDDRKEGLLHDATCNCINCALRDVAEEAEELAALDDEPPPWWVPDALDDDGLDDDDEDEDEPHPDDCTCGPCCHAQMVGLATVGGDDPLSFLETFGTEGLAAIGRRTLDSVNELDAHTLDLSLTEDELSALKACAVGTSVVDVFDAPLADALLELARRYPKLLKVGPPAGLYGVGQPYPRLGARASDEGRALLMSAELVRTNDLMRLAAAELTEDQLSAMQACAVGTTLSTERRNLLGAVNFRFPGIVTSSDLFVFQPVLTDRGRALLVTLGRLPAKPGDEVTP